LLNSRILAEKCMGAIYVGITVMVECASVCSKHLKMAKFGDKNDRFDVDER
jgi:hypothetical protein